MMRIALFLIIVRLSSVKLLQSETQALAADIIFLCPRFIFLLLIGIVGRNL